MPRTLLHYMTPTGEAACGRDLFHNRTPDVRYVECLDCLLRVAPLAVGDRVLVPADHRDNGARRDLTGRMTEVNGPHIAVSPDAAQDIHFISGLWLSRRGIQKVGA